MITECANCYTIGECFDDGEAYICVNREACRQCAAGLDFDTPRRSTARVPIFCQSCGKQGKVVYRKDDNPRYGGGHYNGPTMRLVAYLAGAPKVCQACEKAMMEAIDLFE